MSGHHPAAVRDKVSKCGFADDTSAANGIDDWCKPIRRGDGLFARPDGVGVGESALYEPRRLVN